MMQLRVVCAFLLFSSSAALLVAHGPAGVTRTRMMAPTPAIFMQEGSSEEAPASPAPADAPAPAAEENGNPLTKDPLFIPYIAFGLVVLSVCLGGDPNDGVAHGFRF